MGTLAETLDSTKGAHKLSIAAVMERLDDDDREAFKRALEDRVDANRFRISGPKLVEMMDAAGFTISIWSIKDYRSTRARSDA